MSTFLAMLCRRAQAGMRTGMNSELQIIGQDIFGSKNLQDRRNLEAKHSFKCHDDHLCIYCNKFHSQTPQKRLAGREWQKQIVRILYTMESCVKT